MSVTPPRPKLPPLNALRAFEAAARLGGFVVAAEELCVTPGAISQHIKTLEEWVGTDLFVRRSQGVVLTKSGRDVAAEFTGAFDALGLATRKLRSGTAPKELAVAALPSVAQLWLSPRLPAIRALLPHLNISITALEKRPNLFREMFDISVFLDAARESEGEIVLETDMIYPVCAPSVAARMRHTDDLARETFLYDATWSDDWAKWLGEAKTAIQPKTGPEFSLYSLAVEEAQNGAGVLIGHHALVAERVTDGLLVAPFTTRVRSGLSLNIQVAPNAPAANRMARMLSDQSFCGRS